MELSAVYDCDLQLADCNFLLFIYTWFPVVNFVKFSIESDHKNITVTKPFWICFNSSAHEVFTPIVLV